MDAPVFGNSTQVRAVRFTRPLDQRAPLARAIYSKGRLRQTSVASIDDLELANILYVHRLIVFQLDYTIDYALSSTYPTLTGSTLATV